jgi:hypothetical protein
MSHVHCVVTGGGLSAEGTQWRACRRRFLLALKALSPVFRGKYLTALGRLRSAHRLTFAGARAPLAEDHPWTAVLEQLRQKPWVVYAKPPFGSAEQVLKYLSRYVYRVAISNTRLVFVGDGVVRFRYKNYAAGGVTQVRQLPAEEFLRRFLLHVVPPHFVRIRHCGLLAKRTPQAKLTRCRHLLAVAPPTGLAALPSQNTPPAPAGPEPLALGRCPACGVGRLRVITRLAPQRGIPP